LPGEVQPPEVGAGVGQGRGEDEESAEGIKRDNRAKKIAPDYIFIVV